MQLDEFLYIKVRIKHLRVSLTIQFIIFTPNIILQLIFARKTWNMFSMATHLRFVFTFCGIFSIFQHGHCHKYQYNPISRECELMVNLPGRPAHVSLTNHKTDTRYSQDYGGVGVGNAYGHIPSTSYNKAHSTANSKYNSHSQYGAAYDTDIDTRPSASSAASHLSNNYHSKTQSEIELQSQRDREIEKEVLRELELEKEKERLRELEKERLRELEKEREIEKRLRDREIERELLKEKEREAQLYEATYEQSKASSSSNYNSGSDRYPNSSPVGPYDDVYPSTSTGIKDSSSYASIDSSSAYVSSSSALGSSGLSNSAKSADYIYNEGVLAAHNNLRAKHGVNLLTLDDALMNSAQQHATRLARIGSSYEQSLNAKLGKYGESIAVRHGGLSPYEVTNIWYKENRNYDYSYPQLVYTPTKNSNVHFTALVWKSTTKIGVGKATDINGKTYVVANYWPPGNYEGLLTENVFAPLY